MTADPVRVEHDGALAVITLDRPDVLNAFDEAMTTALTAAVRAAAEDRSVRAVVLTGAGRAFSAGQDLRDRSAALERGEELHLGDELRRRYHPLITLLRTMRKPVVAAVNGVVAGAGLGVVCACDIRVASASASFRAAWAKVGLVPDAGSAYFLPRIVGWGRAVHMIVTGDPVTADDALRMGLVTRVWADDVFAAEWRTFGRELAAAATGAIALSKQGLNAGAEGELSDFLEIESELQDRAGRSADYAEGVRSFLEKRPARFRGE